jgi:hypothetical protein
MTPGHPPVVAITEARQKAKAGGQITIALDSLEQHPFDFMIFNRDCVSLVRVRRLRYPGFETLDIERSCAYEIAELREIPVTEEIRRELHVRGPDRAWHRYWVLPDSIEALNDEE